MTEETTPIDETDPGFWWAAARRLKHAGDAAWNAARAVRLIGGTPWGTTQPKSGKAHLTQAEWELHASAVFLAALAIEYLAIAILVNRAPGQFLKRPPNHRLRQLVAQCDVAASPAQEKILQHMETGLRWDKHATPFSTETREVLRQSPFAGTELMLTPEDKAATDGLFQSLKETLARELAEQIPD